MIIHRQINYIALLLILLWITGCSSAITQQPGLPSAMSPTPTVLEGQPTRTPTPAVLVEQSPQTPIPASNLQITYIQETSNGLDGIYAIDVICQTSHKLCPGEPNFLFQTFPSSNNDPNKPKGLIYSYSWSPDGRKIVLSAGKDIFIGDMKPQGWQNITNSPDTDEYDPQWSSDGKYIYYQSCPGEPGNGFCRLVRSTPKGEGKVNLLNLVDNSIDYFTVSPDDQLVIFAVPEHGFDKLYQSHLDGSEIRPITATNSEEMHPSFSLDGRMLVFVRNNGPTIGTGKHIANIIMRDMNSGEEKNLTEKFEEQAFSPVFSPEGEWVVFTAFDEDSNGNVYAISIDGTVLLQVTQRTIDKTFPSWRLMRNP